MAIGESHSSHTLNFNCLNPRCWKPVTASLASNSKPGHPITGVANAPAAGHSCSVAWPNPHFHSPTPARA
eukprot:CAMPEP_0204294842 /NCGR_PEP_ID=MMETSP0468-20130131/68711_1 /ASSEMBLY_ACC=CAM_ASM_000383 /TAXON_ID=2969 /ORGANISM="Oxyrrhis marina" /LENGTH=69 /DNA_ID=CAMNT_0051273433 /DNA_START=116 /DNA_END=322 /DNA_ORIENTATION=+